MSIDIHASFYDKHNEPMLDKYYEEYTFDFDHRFFNGNFMKEFIKQPSLYVDRYERTLTLDAETMIRIIDKVCRTYDKQARYGKKEMKRYNYDMCRVCNSYFRKENIKFIYENIKYFQRFKQDILTYKPSSIYITIS